MTFNQWPMPICDGWEATDQQAKAPSLFMQALQYTDGAVNIVRPKLMILMANATDRPSIESLDNILRKPVT